MVGHGWPRTSVVGRSRPLGLMQFLCWPASAFQTPVGSTAPPVAPEESSMSTQEDRRPDGNSVISEVFWRVSNESRISCSVRPSPDVAEMLRKSHRVSRMLGAVVGAPICMPACPVGSGEVTTAAFFRSWPVAAIGCRTNCESWHAPVVETNTHPSGAAYGVRATVVRRPVGPLLYTFTDKKCGGEGGKLQRRRYR